MKTIAILLFLPLAVAMADPVGTARVSRGDLSVTFVATGKVEAASGAAVSIKPRAWQGGYRLVDAVAPGTRVDLGDVVMRFDPEALEEAVADARFEFEIAETELSDMLEAQRISAAAEKHQLNRRRRSLEQAQHERKMFTEHELPSARKRRKLDLQSSEQSLKNARQEFEELLRMYGEDELVDETEKIVVERQRWAVEYREALHEMTLRRLEVAVINEQERQKTIDRSVEESEVALERSLREARIAERTRRISEMRGRRSHDKRARRLERLEHDLSATVVRAPVAGILLHGPLEGALGRNYRTGQNVNTGEDVVTIVQPDKLVAVLNAPEKQVLALKVGQTVRLTPTAAGATPVAAVVQEVAALPDNGKLRLVCRPETPLAAGLLGVGIEGRIETHFLEDVLLVPLKAVRRDQAGAYVWIKKDDKVRVRGNVKLGPDDGKKVVVEEGLAEGSLVLLGAKK